VIAMREDYINYLPEREFVTSEIREELDSLYDEISTAQELEND
jgi:uncharacterized protein YqgQ